MRYISNIELLGEKLSIKDAEARSAIEALGAAKKYLFIGDSYMAGWTPDGTVESFATKIINKLGIDGTVIAQGGEGFAHYGPNGSFLTRLSSYTGNRDAVTDIIVAGGFNDKGESVAAITAAIESFCGYAKTNFPNARVHIAFIGWSTHPTDYDELNRVQRSYSNCSSANGFAFIGNAEYILHFTDFFSSDGFHPNAIGQQALANFISSYIAGGSIDVNYEPKIAGATIYSDFTYSGTFYTSLNNYVARLYNCTANALQCNITQSNWNGFKANRHQIGVLTRSHVLGFNNTGDVTSADALAQVTVPTIAQINGTWIPVTLVFELISAGIFINVIATNGTGYASGTMTAIIIPPFNLAADSSIN